MCEGANIKRIWIVDRMVAYWAGGGWDSSNARVGACRNGDRLMPYTIMLRLPGVEACWL